MRGRAAPPPVDASPTPATAGSDLAPTWMTNPPQNPKVRKALLRDLMEYGISLEPAICSSPSLVPSAIPMVDLVPQGWDDPYDVESPKARALRLQSNLQRSDGTFVGTTSRNGPCKGGGSSDSSGAYVGSSEKSPSHWRNVHSGRSDRPLGAQEPKTSSEQHATSSAPKTASMPQNAPAGGRSAAAGDAPAATAGGVEGDHWQPTPKLIKRAVSDSELHNGIASLRTQGRMHRAAVGDRFRFGADLSVSGSMVLAGAGAVAVPQGAWASDAAQLSSFHNGAMRNANPSRLEEIKEVKTSRRKREKDDMQLSGSGRFLRRYPGDSALQSLKDMRLSMFPPEEVVEKVAPKPDHVAEMAQALKAEFGGHTLIKKCPRLEDELFADTVPDGRRRTTAGHHRSSSCGTSKSYGH